MRTRPPLHYQHGVVLPVTLVILLIVALIALAAMRNSIMQNMMAANFYDRQGAFQAAQAALRQGENVAQGNTLGAAGPYRDCTAVAQTPSGVTSVCLANPFTDPNLPTNQIFTVATTVFNAGSLAAGQPQYVVEFMGNFILPTQPITTTTQSGGYNQGNQKLTADYYRITARSSDPAVITDRAVVTLQSIYHRDSSF
jgi:type IV pilus assembly protein PilX